LSSLLSQEQVARFEEWQSNQRAKRFAALFDPRNTPTTTQLVDAVKSIDFTNDSTFTAFQKVAFQFPNTPRIPLIRTPLYEFSVRLGGGLGSPTLIGASLEIFGETAANTKWHKYAEKFVPDPINIFDFYHRLDYPDPNYYFQPRQPPGLEPSPIEYGFCIGKIMGQTLGDKSALVQDTDFILILSAHDKSLWIVHNYYPLRGDGGPARWQPVEISGLVLLTKISHEDLFDCLQLLDSVNKWDPDKPLPGISITPPPPSRRFLVAAPADCEQLKKFNKNSSGERHR